MDEKEWLGGALRTIIDWDAPEEEFDHQLREMFRTCELNHKVFALPVRIEQGEAFAAQVGLLMAAVNCKDCSGLCCRQDLSVNKEGIGLIGAEVEAFQKRGNGRLIKQGQEGAYVDYPCPFYSEAAKGKHCTIYRDRPLACILFPFQPGGFVGNERQPALALPSSCPEGRRIAKLVYMHTYRTRKKLLDIAKSGL